MSEEVAWVLACIVALALSYLCLVYAAYRVQQLVRTRRAGHGLWAAAAMATAVLLVFANPIASSMLLHAHTDAIALSMREDMARQFPVGSDASALVAHLGPPRRAHGAEQGETWYFSTSPWYAWGWYELGVAVDGGAIQHYWLDD